MFSVSNGPNNAPWLQCIAMTPARKSGIAPIENGLTLTDGAAHPCPAFLYPPKNNPCPDSLISLLKISLLLLILIQPPTGGQMRGLCSSGRLSLGLRGAPPRGEPTKTISATFALLDMSRSISFDNFIMTYRHLLHTLLNLYIIQDSAINLPYRCGVLYWRDDCSSHTN